MGADASARTPQAHTPVPAAHDAFSLGLEARQVFSPAQPRALYPGGVVHAAPGPEVPELLATHSQSQSVGQGMPSPNAGSDMDNAVAWVMRSSGLPSGSAALEAHLAELRAAMPEAYED